MKISLWCVGKSHEQYIEDGVAIFTNRISHYYPVEWKIFTSPAYGTCNQDQVRKAEAAPILSSLKSNDVLITLDEKGKQWTSIELADFIQQKANDSSKNLIFLIGGAYGTHESLFKRSLFIWSLSKLVFPHQLVRLILSEQIYRACSINRNEKYHHS
ncbi:MAG: 23S rRNA (pseudouridine(1915)-N(3))-methyltransferase RlmH [Ginsengibacter sp.]